MAEALYPADPILLVDDEPSVSRVIALSLRQEGLNHVMTLSDSREAADLFGKRKFSVVALDLSMPGVSGMELLELMARDYPETTVVVISASYDIDTAVRCMRVGAFDYISKASSEKDVVSRIRKAVERYEAMNERANLKDSLLAEGLKNPEAFRRLIGRSAKTLNALKYVEAIAPTSLTVLITGETGVGKELLAEAVHLASGRRGPFVPVNAAGLDDNMFSDTLFGHERGAFTGAEKQRPGLIEQAAGGTLFLDEIGDLSAASQVKLLRLLQERKYYPVGSDTPKLSTARVVAATNKDLKALCAQGAFRQDLYYRLRPCQVKLPPLRERGEDLPDLIATFVREAAEETGRPAPRVPRELFALLGAYRFPGNIRELRGMIFDAVSHTQSDALSLKTFRDILSEEDLPAIVERDLAIPANGGAVGEIVFPDPLPSLKAASEALVQEALRRTGGNKTLAAGHLGVTRQALQNRLRRPSIDE